MASLLGTEAMLVRVHGWQSRSAAWSEQSAGDGCSVSQPETSDPRGAQRRYAIANPQHWQGYGKNIWGMSASDGPGPASDPYRGKEASFLGYAARGVGIVRIVDDGTIAPTAAISSLPFAAEIVLAATPEMYQRFGSSIYSSCGFRDAFNPSFRVSTERSRGGKDAGWVARDYIGIDEGPILAMIENYRSQLVWRVMQADPYLREGLERAGFSGGWLEERRPLNPATLSCACGSRASRVP
jgi:hypothetical protein